MKTIENSVDKAAQGWAEHDRFQLETGRRMSFRARLGWLEDADRTIRFLARKRRWIDKDGVIHEPSAAPRRSAPLPLKSEGED